MTSESRPSLPEEHERLAPAAPPLSPASAPLSLPSRRRNREKQIAALAFGLLLLYLGASYLLMPAYWKHYTRRHPALRDLPGITHTGSGIPADPLNVALIGTRAEVLKIMLAAKWDPADPLTFRSCLGIAAATVLRRPYPDAPVSNLYLWGRKEDLAFEQPVGSNPKQRHHVRFWQSDKVDPDGRPVWMGAAIYDRKVGFSHTTGQITHHTAGDIDTERDKLFADLKRTGDLAEDYLVPGFHKVLTGRNGGGDPWHTDGNLYVGVIGPLLSRTGP